MGDEFAFDVFLSHSSKDKAVVRPVAERLRADGLRVWFDEWELRAGDHIQVKIEDGLEKSRVLVLCMSAQAFGSDWAQLEAGTFRFRDPLNKERRFVPLRLDEAPIRSALAPFLYVNWRVEDREQEYAKLLEACRGPKPTVPETQVAHEQSAEKDISLDCKGAVLAYAFSPDCKRVLTAGQDGRVRLWDLDTGRCLRVLKGHTMGVLCLAWSADQRQALSVSHDYTLRLWDVETGAYAWRLEGHKKWPRSVVWSTDQGRALTGADDNTVRLWDVAKGRCLRVLEGHTGPVLCVASGGAKRRALSGSDDRTLRLWDVETGRCLRVLEGHAGPVSCAAWSPDKRRALSGSADRTLRLWDMETGRCLRVFEGHTSRVQDLVWSADQCLALSGSRDKTVRLWAVATGRCMSVLEGHNDAIQGVAWSVDQRQAFSGDMMGAIRAWDLSTFITAAPVSGAPLSILPPLQDQIQYTNAKVLLVGDSSAGKTGLSMRLASDDWKPSDSTVGAWATHWKLPVSSADGVEREIWLWDFGGQADQRLIHQLYMEDTALAVLVFDGQKEDLFETLGQWDRDLTRASRKAFTKVLVAGRVDAGGLRFSRSQIDKFAEERGFACVLETSAKSNLGCPELKAAILAGIRWADIPWRSSPLLFKRLKEEIVQLKDEGRVLMRFNELRDALRLRLAGEDNQFKDAELKAVVSLLAGPGVVWELAFGYWVLLQPERINAYAQAVIRTLRADQHELGSIAEERVLRGELAYQSSKERLPAEEERFVLLAMHQTLVERGLCLRQRTSQGPLLVFPSYYGRERPDLVGHPSVLVSYRFTGFLDDIYATLVVRLYHTEAFEQDQLWRYAADFKTLTGKQLGVKLTRRAEGAGELEVYFEPAIPVEEKIIFSRYIHEHLLEKGQDVVRLRHYVCPHCGTAVGNREVAMRKLEAGKKDVICVECEKRILLWDQMEELFASAKTKQRVHELQEQSAVVLDNESKERALVGEVISTVALAGQISREFNVSHHRIDMEIEFKDDDGKPTGRKVYLELKSADSYDETDISYLNKKQAFPVMLLIRNSEGEVRWMEVSDWLKRGRIFAGERFDVMSVRRWREKALIGS